MANILIPTVFEGFWCPKYKKDVIHCFNKRIKKMQNGFQAVACEYYDEEKGCKYELEKKI